MARLSFIAVKARVSLGFTAQTPGVLAVGTAQQAKSRCRNGSEGDVRELDPASQESGQEKKRRHGEQAPHEERLRVVEEEPHNDSSTPGAKRRLMMNVLPRGC
jgi:hypothetical protein